MTNYSVQSSNLHIKLTLFSVITFSSLKDHLLVFVTLHVYRHTGWNDRALIVVPFLAQGQLYPEPSHSPLCPLVGLPFQPLFSASLQLFHLDNLLGSSHGATSHPCVGSRNNCSPFVIFTRCKGSLILQSTDPRFCWYLRCLLSSS